MEFTTEDRQLLAQCYRDNNFEPLYQSRVSDDDLMKSVYGPDMTIWTVLEISALDRHPLDKFCEHLEALVGSNGMESWMSSGVGYRAEKLWFNALIEDAYSSKSVESEHRSLCRVMFDSIMTNQGAFTFLFKHVQPFLSPDRDAEAFKHYTNALVEIEPLTRHSSHRTSYIKTLLRNVDVGDITISDLQVKWQGFQDFFEVSKNIEDSQSASIRC